LQVVEFNDDGGALTHARPSGDKGAQMNDYTGWKRYVVDIGASIRLKADASKLVYL
jgi:hypothetical protein